MDAAQTPVERSSPSASYDEVPYSVTAFAQTHPDHLATVATVFGMRSAAPDRCRVLELGCALGGNLIPMAMSCPYSAFVGIDLSQRQIGEGRKTVDQLGLKNIELRAMSIVDIDDSLGTFDYILAHGVYSWVPPDVQAKVLQVCRRNLSPGGVAYVSYNTLPGWHARSAVREMLWYHTARVADPAGRLRAARELLELLLKSMPDQLAGYSALVRQELEVLREAPDNYLMHEHLEEYNQPLYFHQFMDRAGRAGLAYLGEAQVSTMSAARFGPEVEQTLRKMSPDLLHLEQYMDFLRNRMFRQTLLCRSDLNFRHSLRPEAVMKLRVASSAGPVSQTCDLRSGEPEQFRSGAGPAVTTREPLMKAALVHLWRQWPMTVPFHQLLAAAREGSGATQQDAGAQSAQLAARLLNCYFSEVVQFSTAPPPYVVQVSPRPVASPYARLRSLEGDTVVNMRLEAIHLAEPLRKVLRLLDGQHDRGAVAQLVGGWGPGAVAGATSAQDAADRVLQGFARAALLVG